jgi:hypothetical protein
MTCTSAYFAGFVTLPLLLIAVAGGLALAVCWRLSRGRG